MLAVLVTIRHVAVWGERGCNSLPGMVTAACGFWLQDFQPAHAQQAFSAKLIVEDLLSAPVEFFRGLQRNAGRATCFAAALQQFALL